MTGSPVGRSELRVELVLAGSVVAQTDDLLPDFAEKHTSRALDTLCRLLSKLRSCLGPPERADDKLVCQAHPLFALLQNDPYTHGAFTNVHGCAGNAMILVYLTRSPPQAASNSGLEVFPATTANPKGESVAWRRDFLSPEMDEVAERVDEPRILAVACGHLRKADASEASSRDGMQELLALAQEPKSFGFVATEYAHLPLMTMAGSVSQLRPRRTTLKPFVLLDPAGNVAYLQVEAR
jgi:hypothetical protein